jgi:quercetin dioxygenase-like cupin family protein
MTIDSAAIRNPGAGRTAKWFVALSTALMLPLSASLAQDAALPQGFKAQALLKTDQTRDGDPLRYPGGTPQITSVIGTIEPGGRTPLHQHPVPTYVYVLEGQVELRTEGRDPHVYKTGEAYVEALNRNHQLFNAGGAPAKVLVVFVGEAGTATTIAAKQ